MQMNVGINTFTSTMAAHQRKEKIKHLRDEMKLRTAFDYRVLKIVTQQPRPSGAAAVISFSFQFMSLLL